MHSRGQAFSTFQLLISAIVAVTILVILLHILGLVRPPGTSENPSETMATIVKEAVNSLATPKGGGTVTMFKANSMVTSEAVANKADVGLEPEQICISPGEFMSDTEIIAPGERGSDPSKNWEAFDDGSKVEYRGSKKMLALLWCAIQPQQNY